MTGINIAPRVKNINHAQFADDTLLINSATLRSATIFKKEMDAHKEVSGSEISLRKSKIYGWNCTPREILDISRVLGMEGTMMWESISYLRIPLVMANPRNSLWLPLLDKIKGKIQAWGAKWLNKAGKIVLINSVLASMPIYQTSTLLAPKAIVNNIDKLIRKFLWEGGKNGQGKMHLVS